MKRPDRPLVPPERRRRPHVDAFADLTPIDEPTLIERSQLLDAIAGNDDIEWKTDPFKMRQIHCHDYIRGFARALGTAEEPLQRVY
jgi:hypothetical protein